MSLRPSRRSGSVVLLDDDADYLEKLTRLLPRQRPIRLFQHPATLIQHLKFEQRLRECNCLPESGLQDWAALCVVDLGLQGMDGLQVYSELAGWPGVRMLLVDPCDERIAQGAVTRGLVDRYLVKHDFKLVQRLAEAIEDVIEQA